VSASSYHRHDYRCTQQPPHADKPREGKDIWLCSVLWLEYKYIYV